MKRHLNTLYVMTQGAYVARDGETAVVRFDHETKLQVPLLAIGSIVCFGQVSCSPALMQSCGERNIALSFLSEHGRFMARVVGATHGNVLLRREQYRRADDDAATRDIVVPIIAAKVLNGRASLLRALRDRPDCEKAELLRSTPHAFLYSPPSCLPPAPSTPGGESKAPRRESTSPPSTH